MNAPFPKKPKPENSLYGDLPMGFGMALLKNPTAMEHFARLSEEEKREIVEGVHGISSRAEMRDYVDRTLLTNDDEYAATYKNTLQ